MDGTQTRTGTVDAPYWRRISWGAVFAGVILAIVVHLTLSLLGLAIGLGITAEANISRGIGIGAAVWWIIVTLVALFIGGWTAGKLCGIPVVFDSVMHGLVVWGLTVIITLWILAGTLATVMGGAFGVLQTAMGQAAQMITPEMRRELGEIIAMQDPVYRGIMQEAEQVLRQNARQGVDIESAQDELESALNDLMGADPPAQEERQRTVNVLMQYTTLTEQQAGSQVDNWFNRAQQSEFRRVQEEAAEIAEQSARVAAGAALWSFLMLVFGALAAAFGGYTGTPTLVETRR